MFRLIRLAVLLMIAFAGGVFYERGNQMQACEAAGGTWAAAGMCVMRSGGQP